MKQQVSNTTRVSKQALLGNKTALSSMGQSAKQTEKAQIGGYLLLNQQQEEQKQKATYGR